MNPKLRKKLSPTLKHYKFPISVLLTMLTMVVPVCLSAQVGGNNLFEYQVGNIPETEPSDLNTLYNQTNLTYKHKKINIRLRLEQFYNSDVAERNYISLSQYHIKYRNKKIRLEVGTLYETLGRGLLLRTYEIKALF